MFRSYDHPQGAYSVPCQTVLVATLLMPTAMTQNAAVISSSLCGTT